MKTQEYKKSKKLLSFINFVYAFHGVLFLIRRERNALFYLIAMALLTFFGCRYHIVCHDWIALILAMSLVWMAEALNTAIELLADEISEEQRERLGRAKDVAAGGVLLAALGMAVVVVIVFLPYVRR